MTINHHPKNPRSRTCETGLLLFEGGRSITFQTLLYYYYYYYLAPVDILELKNPIWCQCLTSSHETKMRSWVVTIRLTPHMLLILKCPLCCDRLTYSSKKKIILIGCSLHSHLHLPFLTLISLTDQVSDKRLNNRENCRKETGCK